MNWTAPLISHLRADETLSALGGRFFDSMATTVPTPPYLIFQEITSGESTAWDGSRGGSYPLVQFTIWATSFARARVLRELLRASIEGKEIGSAAVSIVGTETIHDTDANLYGAILETRFHISSN